MIERVTKRWADGRLLRSWAERAPWTDIEIPLRGPTPADLTARFDDVREWRSQWHRQQQRLGTFTLESRSVGARSIGSNDLPSRAIVTSWGALWRLLDVTALVERFAAIRAATEATQPGLIDWMNARPMTALAHEASWEQLVATNTWLITERNRGSYLRQVPIPGVDTKFIESNRSLLSDLLDNLLPPGAIAEDVGRSQFARRYGFATPPPMLRFRLLTHGGEPVVGLTEVAVRVAEFAAAAPDLDTVFIVENEVTYLAFPQFAGAAIIFGSGYALSALAEHAWFESRQIHYWGDLDTHGFAILAQLRRRHPHTRSFLMDRPTLLEHRGQWVREERPTRQRLDDLTTEEHALYTDLVEGTYGSQIRLEQERIGFMQLQAALAR